MNSKKHGKDHAICCPFHEEKTASCVVSEKKNVYHCFGCGASGTVVDWVMKTKNVSFREAVLYLQQRLGGFETEQTTLPPLASNLSDDDMLKTVVDFYHETLKQSQEAHSYLASRGLDSEELISEFQLGYANRTLGYRMPAKSLKAGKDVREQLQRVGLYRESGHEHFNGSLVVPIFDSEGNVVEMYGRKIVNKLRKGTPKHLYKCTRGDLEW